MTAFILHRIDPARNMRRFYLLAVQPDLFGQWCLIREWGRTGQGGQVRAAAFPTEEEAWGALIKQHQAKERRGYSCSGTFTIQPFPFAA
jgi:predicted DNA-binding WGR domain protein